MKGGLRPYLKFLKFPNGIWSFCLNLLKLVNGCFRFG